MSRLQKRKGKWKTSLCVHHNPYLERKSDEKENFSRGVVCDPMRTSRRCAIGVSHAFASGRILSLVPGPTRVSAETLAVYGQPWDESPDVSDEFFSTYADCVSRLAGLLGSDKSGGVAIMSGEAMAALWGAVKSVVGPGDRVVCLSNGLYGTGFAGMARTAGAAETVLVESDWRGRPDLVRLEKELVARPTRMVTAVHCETPSGVLNTADDMKRAGELCARHGALFCVDFVASAFGTPVHVADWKIDLGLLGAQKAMSLPQDLGVVTVSQRAWKAIETRKYEGYDALLPFRTAVEKRYMPYTHNWRAIAAMSEMLKRFRAEEVFARHLEVAAYCRKRVTEMGLEMYPSSESLFSPTVTAVNVPAKWEWSKLRHALREEGVVLGGSYGPLQDKVFRIGHMGNQADMEMVATALDKLERILKHK